jgi:hypothetical protein
MRTVHFFATYYQQEKQAITLIQSLLMQTEDNWKLTICSNADPTVNNIPITDDRINVVLKEENSEFWGAKNRRDFYQEVDGGVLVVMTSCEDYYVPKTVQYINERDEDFIYWDFSHHHFEHNTTYAISQPRLKKIDWGNFAILSDLSRGVSLDKLKTRDAENPQEMVEFNGWEEFMGDGFFVEEVFKTHSDISNIRLPKILFCKN